MKVFTSKSDNHIHVRLITNIKKHIMRLIFFKYIMFRPQVQEIALLGSITTFKVLSALDVGAPSRFCS